MGAPPQSLLDSLNVNGSIWSKILEAQRAKLSQTIKRRSTTRSMINYVRRNKRVLIMKRRSGNISNVCREGSRTIENNGIERRVRALKRLVPKNDESQGLEGLFRDAAAYIMSLQMRVRVMQIMVDVLAPGGSNQDDH